MALADEVKDHAIEVIEEYLMAAQVCLATAKPDGGILGYSAALLLLCATDAIGKGVLRNPGKGLDVLACPFFRLTLKEGQIGNLKKWYRNGLVHAGVIARGAFLASEMQGAPFDFDANDALTLIRVPVFYAVVKDAWARLDKAADFNPREQNDTPDFSAQQARLDSSFTASVSGLVPPTFQIPSRTA